MGISSAPVAGAAARRFDLVTQRALGAGLGVALVQAVLTAVLGRQLYPGWWWWSGAPLMLVVALVALAACARGSFGPAAQIAFTLGAAVSAALAAVATGPTVYGAGTAVLPLVLVAIIGTGLLAPAIRAAVLGGTVIFANALIPAMLRVGSIGMLLIEGGIQLLLLAAAVAGGHASRHLAAVEEQAHAQLATAIATDRAAAAARVARRELERAMHDTVLNTLSAIGRSSLQDTASVRLRCATDARFLRALHADEETDGDLVERLRIMTEPLTDETFRIDLSTTTALAVGLPPEVATAILRATRESLNNAREHSGAGSAAVRLDLGPDRVTVQVTDRGSGTGASPDSRRLGVRRSITERMDDVGGRAEIRSVPGAGTTVVMTWPR